MSGKTLFQTNRNKKEVKSIQPPKSIDLFSTVYGGEAGFKPDGPPRYVPKYGRYNEPVSHEVRRSKEAPVAVKFPKTCYGYSNEHDLDKPSEQPEAEVKVRKSLVDPPLKQNSTRKVVIPKAKQNVLMLSARVGLAPPPKKVLPPPPTPNTAPKVANDPLFMFDDEEFDSPEFVTEMKERLKQGPVKGRSLFFNEAGKAEWKDCFVTGYEDGKYVITFDLESDKTKEVPRIALELDSDDDARFQERRSQALANRAILDQDLRRESYLSMRAGKLALKPHRGLITGPLAKVGCESPLIEKLIVEVVELFSYAHALIDFEDEWKDPIAAEKFRKYGLLPLEVENKPSIEVPKLDKERITCLRFAAFSEMVDVVSILREIEENGFLRVCFGGMSKPVHISCFFEEISAALTVKIEESASFLKREGGMKILEILDAASEDESERYSRMLDLRYEVTVAKIVEALFNNFFEEFARHEIKIDNCVEKDLVSMTYPFEQVRSIGLQYFEMYHDHFKDRPPVTVNPRRQTPLTIEIVSLDNAYKDLTSEWNQTIDQEIALYDSIRATILNMTKDIPDDPEAACIELFGDDFKLDSPRVTIPSLNLDKIRERLTKARACLDEYELNYGESITTKLFRLDIKLFTESVHKRHEQFYNSVFAYLTKLTDNQFVRIGQMVKQLDFSSGKIPNDIEEWNEKHGVLNIVQQNVKELDTDLDDGLSILDFMSDFLYTPEKSYQAAYEVKRKLHHVAISIHNYRLQDARERKHFIEIHRENIKILNEELHGFLVELDKFHVTSAIENIVETFKKLCEAKKSFDELLEKCKFYQKRDAILSLQTTNYPLLDDIRYDFDIFTPVWTVGNNLETIAQSWLATDFRQLNVDGITKTLLAWRQELNNVIEKLKEIKNIPRFAKLLEDKDQHPLVPDIEELTRRTDQLISHLPIITALCNKHLRGRHWDNISRVVGMPISPNDGINWNWLMESGIEDHMLAIAAISRAADMEFKIERTLLTMIEEMQAMRLRVNEKDGVMRLEDPTYAVVMLGNHQQKMQEIFIPPYVKPFMSKIRDYDALASNLRQILKQTIRAQQKIDELKPAMDSHDLRTQHEEMTERFDDQVQKFNEFTKSFKLSLSFHQIVSNQRYVDISTELSENFVEIREQLTDVLEEKRKLFPRFRFLSDAQLVAVISNCASPSKTKDIFSLMYPSIAEAIIEDEKFCTGFISLDGEKFIFSEKVQVTPDGVEVWYKAFDEQIRKSMQMWMKQMLEHSLAELSRVATNYPTQIVLLILEIMFTRKIKSCMNIFGKRSSAIVDRLNNAMMSVNTDLSNMFKVYKTEPTKQRSALVMALLNQREMIQRMIDAKIESPLDPTWYGMLKYHAEGTDNIRVTVEIGPNAVDYGFEFTGVVTPYVRTEENDKLFNTIMMSMCGGITPVLCGEVDAHKTSHMIAFCNAIGKQPIVFPCVSSSSLAKIKEMISNAIECGMFICFKDLSQLEPNVLQTLAIEFMNLYKTMPKSVAILGSYSILMRIDSLTMPESLKMAFRPVHLSQVDAAKKFELMLMSMGYSADDDLAKKLSTLSNTVAKAFTAPVNSVLSAEFIQVVIKDGPFVTGDQYREFRDRYVKYIMNILSTHDNRELIKTIDQVLELTCDENVQSEVPPSESRASLVDCMKWHFGTVVLGPPLIGKSTLIAEAAAELGADLSYINPYAQSLSELYGERDSGLLSVLIQEKTTDRWIVFDGQCSTSWMEPISVALASPHRIYFGDGSMLNLTESFRFVFETDDLTSASPATLGYCATFYIDDGFLDFEKRFSHFLKEFEQDKRLFEQVSQVIVGSLRPKSELVGILETFVRFFIPKVQKFIIELSVPAPISLSHCVNNFFRYVYASILNYYVVDTTRLEAKHTADELIEDLPFMLFFALFWSFGGAFVDDTRIKVDEFLVELAGSYQVDLKLANVRISDVYFDEGRRQWLPWALMMENVLFKKAPGGDEVLTIDQRLTDMNPGFLAMPKSTLLPVLYLGNNMVSQSEHVMIYGPSEIDKSVFVDLILNTEHSLANISAEIYELERQCTHEVIRNIIGSLLPEPHSSQGFIIRSPMIALTGFDATPLASSSELVRYIMEHDFFYNNKTYTRDVISGLKFILACREQNLNQRLAHYSYFIRVPQMSTDTRCEALENAIDVLWKVEDSAALQARALVALFEDAGKTFHFDLMHIMRVIQRVAIVQQRRSSSRFVDTVAHELVSVLYDATRSKELLEKIAKCVQEITKGSNFESVFSIADKKILTNVCGNGYKEVSCIDDLFNDDVEEEKPDGKRQTLQFTRSQMFSLEATTIADEMREHCKEMQLDILAVSRILSVPRTHLLILNQSGSSIITETARLLGATMHKKKLNEPLLGTFKTWFFEAGKQKKHHFLLIDHLSLAESERKELETLICNPNVYGLFERGEKLQVMTELHSRGSQLDDPFNECTLESESNYNELIWEFIGNCRTYFHFCIVGTTVFAPEVSKYLQTYIPMFRANAKIHDFIGSHVSENGELYETVLESLCSLPYIAAIPYLTSEHNLKSIVTTFLERKEVANSAINAELQSYRDLAQLQSVLSEFLQSTYEKMTRTEEDLVRVNAEMKASMEQVGELNRIAEEQGIAFQKEAALLKEEEAKADALRKECESQMRATKSILENATKEVKALSHRDMAVIKGMNHPPIGVVLVVRAICAVIGTKLDVIKVDEKTIWAEGRHIMNDASFLNRLISIALDGLSNEILDTLRVLISDPAFEPSQVERSSTAAKSICYFVRSLVPYYEALEQYKERNNQLTELQAHLVELRKRQDKAMEALTRSKKEVTENQMKLEKLTQTKESSEKRLVEQRDQIETFQKVDADVHKYLDEKAEELKKLEKTLETLDDEVFWKVCFMALCGPFDNTMRDTLLSDIKSAIKAAGGQEWKCERKHILIDDEGVTSRWNQFNYPVSLFWKENTVLLSPRPNRWIAAVGLSGCPKSFLSKVMNGPIVQISLNSSQFETMFMAALQVPHSRIVLHDFDFSNPNIWVCLAQHCRDTGETLLYNGAEIEVQSDVVVYFALKDIPENKSFDVDVALVNLRVTSDIAIEQLSLSLFEMTETRKYTELRQLETKIIQLNSDARDKDLEVKKLIEGANVKLFTTRDIQNDYKYNLGKRNEFAKQAETLFAQHQEMMEAFSGVTEQVRAIVEYLEKIPVRHSIWRYFENSYACSHIVMDLEALKKRLSSFIYAEIPFSRRIDSALETFNIEKCHFDENIRKLDELTDGAVLKFQDPREIIKEASSERPTIIISPDSSYVLSSVISILGPEIKFVDSSEILRAVKESVQSPVSVCTVCNSADAMREILSSVTQITSAFVNERFRFFVLCTWDCGNESSLLSNCSLFYLTTPFNIKQLVASVDASDRRLATYNAIVCLERYFRYSSSFFSYVDCKLAGQCDMSDEIVEQFISRYLYETELPVADSRLQHQWEIDIEELSIIDKPELFGLLPKSFDYHKDASAFVREFDPPPEPAAPVGPIPARMQFEFNFIQANRRMNRPTHLFEMMLRQITNPREIDISLLVAPTYFMEVIRFDYFKGNPCPIDSIVLTLDDASKYDETSGSIVTGLLVSNARLENSIFIPCDNCSPLPPVWLRPIQRTDAMKPIGFFHRGWKVYEFYVSVSGDASNIDVITLPNTK